MMALIGEFERETIAQNVKMGMKTRAREGRWCGGTPVLGYEIVKDEGKERKKPYTKMVINTEEARIVRLIFGLHCEGKGYKSIVNELNHRDYRTKRGNYFNISGVREILLNPIYAGKIRFNLRQDWSSKRGKGMNPNPMIVDGLHEPIIDEDTWERSLLIMKAKGKKSVRTHDGYVFVRLAELLEKDTMVKAIIEEINRSHKEQIEPLQKELALIDRELSKLTERKKSLFELYEDGLASKEDFMERKAALNDRMKILEGDKLKYQNRLADGNAQISYELVQQTLHRFGEKIGKCDDQEKLKLLLRLLIKEVTMDETRNIDTIKIQINDDIIRFLAGKEDVPQKGMSSFLMSDTINIEFSI